MRTLLKLTTPALIVAVPYCGVGAAVWVLALLCCGVDAAGNGGCLSRRRSSPPLEQAEDGRLPSRRSTQNALSVEPKCTLGVHQWEVLSLFLIGDIPPNTPQYPYLCRRHGPGPKGPGLWALRDIGGALGGYWRCWRGIGGSLVCQWYVNGTLMVR
jgi:hypothetical protein